MGILESFGSLPTHPLLVHFPIVLVPVTLILAVLAVFWRRYQRGLAIALLCTGVIGGGAGYLAGESGEKLQRRLPNGQDAAIMHHASYGDTAKTLCALLVIMSIVYAVWVWRDRLGMGPGNAVGRVLSGTWVTVVLGVAVIGLSAAATTWVVLAGHSGAEAVWQKAWTTLPPAPAGGGEEG
jgi:uncharacterized membrane protein